MTNETIIRILENGRVSIEFTPVDRRDTVHPIDIDGDHIGIKIDSSNGVSIFNETNSNDRNHIYDKNSIDLTDVLSTPFDIELNIEGTDKDEIDKFTNAFTNRKKG